MEDLSDAVDAEEIKSHTVQAAAQGKGAIAALDGTTEIDEVL